MSHIPNNLKETLNETDKKNNAISMYVQSPRITITYFFRWSDVNLKELRDIVGFSGFRQMALKYAGFGLKEMLRSAVMPLQVMQIQKYIQDITTADVESGPSGVRAQAMGKDGNYKYFSYT